MASRQSTRTPTFRFAYDGRPTTPQHIGGAKVDHEALATMMFRGVGNRAELMPLVGLTVDLPDFARPRSVGELPRRETAAPNGGGAPVAQADLADTAWSITLDVLQRRIVAERWRHLGVMVSGGLDSTLLLAALAELRRLGVLEEVTGFHMAWPHVREMNSEREVAAAMCRFNEVELCVRDYPPSDYHEMLELHADLPYPYVQAYQLYLDDIARHAGRLGVDALISGVGSELHFCGSSRSCEIERFASAEAHGTRRQWTLATGLAEKDLPAWMTPTAYAAQEPVRSESTTAECAMTLTRLHEYREACAVLATEWFLYEMRGNRPVLFYPYLDQQYLEFASTTPWRAHVMRCGAEVYDKALLRMALRKCAPREVYIRSRGAPLEAAEQARLRANWDDAVNFWHQDTVLAELGLLDIDVLRRMLDERRELLTTIVSLFPTMLLETWLRRNPDSI